MVSAIPANRFPALALVAAAHALAIALLLELTRSHSFSGAAEESLTRVEVLPARPRAPTPPLTAAPTPAPRKRAAAPSGEAPMAPPRPPAADAGSAAIDWAAEGAEAAARVARGEDDRDGARKFGTPPPSPMFALAPTRRPGLAWNHARTHRVEALPGGVTVFNLNDHCAIALLWVVPFFGCQVGKIPSRGDLFEHMRDAPGPDLH